MSFPPVSPTTLTKVLKSYLYVQYNDDDDLQAFVSSQNSLTQSYVDWFNTINLPIYTGAVISGDLLDWVAEGIYGIQRPALPTYGVPALGAYNTSVYNNLPYNSSIPPVNQTYYQTSDDTFKRVMTWQLYKGDGKTFNVRWMKRRIYRFLYGLNGTDPKIDQTYNISISFSGPNVAVISIPNTPIGVIFKASVDGGAIEMPFSISWSVTLV